MRKIIKGQTPDALAHVLPQLKGVSWEDFHKSFQPVYEQCMEQAVKEQNGECAYTGIFLNEGNRHLDHFRKRSLYQNCTYTWDNLFAAVKEREYGAAFKDDYVKQENKDAIYAQLLNPAQDNVDDFFQYAYDGKIEPREGLSDINKEKAIETITVFNLNHEKLVAMRREKIREIQVLAEQFPKSDILNIYEDKGFSAVLHYELSQSICSPE